MAYVFLLCSATDAYPFCICKNKAEEKEPHIEKRGAQLVSQTKTIQERRFEKERFHWSSTTIRSILRNQDYIGNTVNCKTKIKSFKAKKQIRLPKEEWLIFENTHEALVSKSDFETVQLILDGRNRPDKSGKVDIFHNVIACASCGNRMYLHRAKTMRPEENYYSCGFYQRKGKDRCSAHQINAMALEQIVLQQIRWVTELARENPEVFYEKSRAKKRDEDEKKLKAVKAEIIKTRKRIDELDRIIQKLYEDNVSGRITDER